MTESKMKILVACEESQAVCKAFREKGHIAFSCDILPCSGGHPEWHIMGDVSKILNGCYYFQTEDNTQHFNSKGWWEWDMVIAFPPCTDLAVSGAKHFEKKREDGRQKTSIEFFCQFLEAECDKVVVENPVNIISGDYISRWYPDLCEKYNLPVKPSQIIQPYEYGHRSKKPLAYGLRDYQILNLQIL